MKRRVTYLAVIRNVLAVERHFRTQAEECRKSQKDWERGLVETYASDADNCKEFAELVKAKKYEKALEFWRGLDTFVRDFIPVEHADWVARRIK